jgi:NADPH:quinone reductase-like Zn-dependent oxidoreductase
MHFDGDDKNSANLKVCEAPIPEIGEGEVLIKVLGSSVNRIDSMQANGKYPIPPGVTQIGGLDCAGYVIDPKTYKPINDQLVMSLLSGGAYSQYATSPKDLLINAPKNMKVGEAASIPEVWLTAYQLLKFVLQVEENAEKTALIYAAAAGVGSSLI